MDTRPTRSLLQVRLRCWLLLLTAMLGLPLVGTQKQMESDRKLLENGLYLRWLEENEQESSEESPLGLILCAEGGHESIALLRLDQAGIRVGQYLHGTAAQKDPGTQT